MLSPAYTPAADPSPDASLDGRIVAVTGATGGMGTALSLELARRGATVVLLGRKLKRLEKLYDSVEALEPPGGPSGTGGGTVPTPAMLELDLATLDATQADAMADVLMAEFGRLDALVHCAVDSSIPAPQAGIDDAGFARTMQVNVLGPRRLTLALWPLLLHSPHASVTFLLDHKPGAYFGAYGLSKASTHALVHVLAQESEGHRNATGAPRVAVNGYDPGPVRTNLRRRYFAGERADAVPAPEERLGPLLSLIRRDDPTLTGAATAAFAPDASVITP